MKVKTLEIPRNQYRMSIISSCNMKCVYCHNEGNNEISMLKLEDIEKIILETNTCPYCGTNIAASFSYCPKCGKSLKD